MMLNALLLTMFSLFLTTDIAYDSKSLAHLKFGWPFAFLEQNQEKFEPPFPVRMYFAWELSSNRPDHPAMQVDWGWATLSVVSNFLLFLLIKHCYGAISDRLRNKKARDA
jgi:hypothetical protein